MPPQAATSRYLLARWVLPISRPPIENGVVFLKGNKIESVFSQAEFERKSPESFVRDYGNAVILPGLINLHSHLDYSSLRLVDVDSPLLSWILSLISHSGRWAREDWERSAFLGARAVALSGTTCVADSSYSGAAARALAQVGLRGVVGLELFGLESDGAEQTWHNWLAKHNQLCETAPAALKEALERGLIRLTVAPHAPYTVCPELWRIACRWASDNRLPLLAHLAESRQEHRWIAGTDQDMECFLKQVTGKAQADFSWKGQGLSPVAHLESQGLLNGLTIAAHVVHVDEADIELLARRSTAVAHCPRSNARLRNGAAPLARLLKAGVALGFGTDSWASTDDLDVLAEARFAWDLARALDPDFRQSAQEAIYRLTLGAARALHLDREIGSIDPGKQADIAVFAVEEVSEPAASRPFDLVLYGAARLRDLFVAGSQVVSGCALLDEQPGDPVA